MKKAILITLWTMFVLVSSAQHFEYEGLTIQKNESSVSSKFQDQNYSGVIIISIEEATAIYSYKDITKYPAQDLYMGLTLHIYPLEATKTEFIAIDLVQLHWYKCEVDYSKMEIRLFRYYFEGYNMSSPCMETITFKIADVRDVTHKNLQNILEWNYKKKREFKKSQRAKPKYRG